MSKRLIDFGGVAVDPEAVRYVMALSDDAKPFLSRIVFADDKYVGVKVPLADVVKAINDYFREKATPPRWYTQDDGLRTPPPGR